MDMGRTLDRARCLIAAAGLLMLSAPAAAQSLAPGQRIRVTAPQLSLQRQAGQFHWLDRDSLVLAAGPQRWVVPRELLTELDSSRGRRGHFVTGLAVGAAVGLGVVAILAADEANGGSGCSGSGNYAEVCAMAAAGIVVSGTGLGGIVGALIRTERWTALDLGSVQFSPTADSSTP